MRTKPTTWLVTGAAGFIGLHVCLRLLARGDCVIGLDNLNDYYEVALKHARLARLKSYKTFNFHLLDVANRDSMQSLFLQVKIKPNRVIHLAAQAGVRYSISNPQAYIDSNIQGFINVLECCRHNAVEHLVYASSSSVYGGNTTLPFSEHHNIDHPVSLYAATKKANELMAHTYSHLFRLPTTGLRFFTVYGPWGRPDMAYFRLINSALNNETFNLYGNGKASRDFTYIDDVVSAIDKLHSDLQSRAFEFSDIVNVGGGNPASMLEMIDIISGYTKIKLNIKELSKHHNDVDSTNADPSYLESLVGSSPKTKLQDGLAQVVEWGRVPEIKSLLPEWIASSI